MSRKRKLSESVKKEVAHRQNYLCCKCEKILPPTYQTDHIIPHSISNDDSLENLQALCPNCHSLKTQRENIRIIKFKSLLSKCCENLCWFCLESVDDMEDHLKSCSKILKDINKTFKPKISVSSLDEMLAMHVYDDSSSGVVSKLKNMKISEESKEEVVSNILFIEIGLDDFFITVNNKYKYKISDGDISPEDVGEAVFYGTRSKKYSKKIDTIEILLSDNEIERNEEDKNACYNYLCDVLLDYLPERLFKKDTDVIFIV
jgi:hypothetical protein